MDNKLFTASRCVQGFFPPLRAKKERTSCTSQGASFPCTATRGTHLFIEERVAHVVAVGLAANRDSREWTSTNCPQLLDGLVE